MQNDSFLLTAVMGKGKLLSCLLCMGVLCVGDTLEARPVSYPEGTTVMLRNTGDHNSLHVHYSPTKNYSVGYRAEYWRSLKFQIHSAQVNHLVRRWNQLESQANFYWKSAFGWAHRKAKYSRMEEEEREGKEDMKKEQSEAAFSVGFASDWEDERYYIAYGNRYLNAGEIAEVYVQNLRIGFAPYVADYGSLHSWIMLDLRHEVVLRNAQKDPQDDSQKDRQEDSQEDSFTLTPLLRFFKSVHLIELGIDNRKKLLFNWIIRF